MSISITVIGPGNQTKKIVTALLNHINIRNLLVFRHRAGLECTWLDETPIPYETTVNLDATLETEVVIIGSPNFAHFEYLKFLMDKPFSGYVFCEKPIVDQQNQLKYIKESNSELKNRLYINFNYRFSRYADTIQNDGKRYGLGRLLHASIISGHGLGFRESYRDSWRSKKKHHLGGVLETVSIHFLDMFYKQYGIPKHYFVENFNTSPYGDSVDNSCFTCSFDSGFSLNLFTSYTSPFISEFLFLYENGYVKFDEGKRVYHPRDIFDEKGLFKTPAIVMSEPISRNQIAQEATEKSVQHFIRHVMKRKSFDPEEFSLSLKSNEIMISLCSS